MTLFSSKSHSKCLPSYEFQTSTEVFRVTKRILSQMLKDNKKLWARNLIGSEKIRFISYKSQPSGFEL